jgi:hypothetical protein
VKERGRELNGLGRWVGREGATWLAGLGCAGERREEEVGPAGLGHAGEKKKRERGRSEGNGPGQKRKGEKEMHSNAFEFEFEI